MSKIQQPPPPMIPTTTIIELSQKNANLVQRNGDYSVTLTEPQAITAGDQLNIKMIAIDSQDADSQSIVLPLDDLPVDTQTGKGFTSLSIGYSYYDMNYDLDKGYATANTILRQKFQIGDQLPSNPYPVDYQPYQPYGAIDARQLNDVDFTFARKYVNGQSGGDTHLNNRLDNYLVKVGFSWYELETDGSHSFHKSDFASNEYIYSLFKDFTVDAAGKPVALAARPQSIASGTAVKCIASGSKGIINFIKGTLQIAQVTLVIKNAVPNVITPTPTAAEYLKYKSQDDVSDKPEIGISNFATIVNDPVQPDADRVVTVTTATNHGYVANTVISISGVTAYPTGGSSDQYNTTHKVLAVTGLTTFTFRLQGALPEHDGDTAQDPTLVKAQQLGPVQLITGTTTVQIPNGRYDRQSMSAALTNAFSIVNLSNAADPFSGSSVFNPSTNLQFRPLTSPFGNIRFRKMDQFKPNDNGVDGLIQFTDGNSYNYRYARASDEPGCDPIIGARKFAFDYGQDGDIFRWIDGHMSVCDPTQAQKSPPIPTETIGFYLGSDNIFHQINAATGIIINDMEPKAFWQDILGLYNNVVEPIQSGTDDLGQAMSYVPYDILRSKVPTESSPLNGFSVLNTRIHQSGTGQEGIPSVAKPLYVDTASIPTNAVLGETPLVIGAGFYLVEILSLNLSQSNFIDNNENRGNISAIVSTQYNANDSITGFADSGIPYIHRGAPAMIASANVRILDPDTKKVPLNLGNRNTVFLQLSSEAPVYVPTVVATNESKPTQAQLRGGV